MPPIKKKQTEVVIPDGTPAKVSEMIDGKRVSYEAQVKENETIETDENGTDNVDDIDAASVFGDNTGEDESESESVAQPIQTSGLERMFKDLASIDKYGAKRFYAMITRMPDSMTDRFNIPCRDMMPLGSFEFTARDLFSFIPAIQKHNGNSGGRFAVRVYDAETSQAVYVIQRRNFHETEREVGLASLHVPNPMPEPVTIGEPHASNGGESAIANLLVQQMREMQEQSQRQFMQQMEMMREQNKPREQSPMEQAIMQKMVNDILNPPDKTGQLEQTLASMFAMPIVVEKMATRMFPDKPTPVEPDWIDKATKVFELPVAQQLITRVGDIGEAIAVSRLQNANQPLSETQNPDNQIDGNDTDEMRELLETIINELETENPLDGSNETMRELAADFPSQVSMLQTMCQTLPFDAVFQMLINQASKMQPFPFEAFLNIPETQTQQKYIWNERGDKLKVRLNEFYEYVRTT